MEQANRIYIAIDLKSFYASVECVERGLDPLTTHLVVADQSRTEKTICLAVSPSLKAYGLSGRARLFEVVQRVEKINRERQRNIHWKDFKRTSYLDEDVKKDPFVKLGYIIAMPRMAFYLKYSTKIYNIYLRYIAAEDIHIYSIDEVFIDATDYLRIYNLSAHALAMKLIQTVLKETGITATAGIGTNLYLAKVAMDIVAKHIPADRDGVRIAELDEYTYRKKLWAHRPLTDFWRVGRGYAKKLEENGMYTMGDVAKCSIGSFYEKYNEDLLYKLFGINAELLIDHAWGYEPCTMKEIKAYKPAENSMGQGQVLMKPYNNEKGLLIAKEMADVLANDLVSKHLVTNGLVLYVGYDVENLNDPKIFDHYNGEITIDWYGRVVPKSAAGSIHFKKPANSSFLLRKAIENLYKEITDTKLLVRRINITCTHTQDETALSTLQGAEQLSLFSEPQKEMKIEKEVDEELQKEKKMQKAMLEIQNKYGKNAVLRGMDFEEDAMTRNRNEQIGGHKA